MWRSSRRLRISSWRTIEMWPWSRRRETWQRRAKQQQALRPLRRRPPGPVSYLLSSLTSFFPLPRPQALLHRMQLVARRPQALLHLPLHPILQRQLHLTRQPLRLMAYHRRTSPGSQNSSFILFQSPAEIEWHHRKNVYGANNAAMDAVMQSTELEDVKRKMLDLLDKIELTRRQNASLKNERFNISLLGNPGTGKTTVARYYAHFLISQDILGGIRWHETTGSLLGSKGIPGAETVVKEILAKGGRRDLHRRKHINLCRRTTSTAVKCWITCWARWRIASASSCLFSPGTPRRWSSSSSTTLGYPPVSLTPSNSPIARTLS